MILKSRGKPRPRHVVVTRERDRGENALAIRLRYHLIDRNVPGNNVLVPHIEQTVVV